MKSWVYVYIEKLCKFFAKSGLIPTNNVKKSLPLTYQVVIVKIIKCNSLPEHLILPTEARHQQNMTGSILRT
ncbi:hypothetical protein ALT1644_580005 [Alteromonas macleodii]